MTQPALIDRARESARLIRALGAARRRHGGMLLVAGEAGVGKTALVEHVLARADLVVLRGSARQAANGPLSPLIAALRSHPAWPSITREVLGRAERKLVRSLFPEIADVPMRARDATPPTAMSESMVASKGAGSSEHPVGARRRVSADPSSPARSPRPEPPPDGAPAHVDSVNQLVVRLSRRAPLVIVLDDLQWTDNATVDLLSALARSAAREALLIVGMYRTDEFPRSSPLRRLRIDVRRSGRLDEIELQPLDATSGMELATRILCARPDSVLGERLLARSQGNPLFIEELAAALIADGAIARDGGVATLADADLHIPDTLRDSVLVRADGLPPPARRAVRVAALAGDQVDASLTEELVPDAGDWIHAATERGIIVERGAEGPTFRHALVREILAQDLTAPERRASHARIASSQAARKWDPLLVAEHLLLAGDARNAIPRLLQAAEAACKVHAYRDAAAALHRVLDEAPDDLPDRLGILERLAECSELAGSVPDAARTWNVAASARAATGEMAAAAQDHRRHAGALELQGRWALAIEARMVAAEAYSVAGLPAESAVERLAAAAHLRSAASYRASREILQVARRQAADARRPDLEARVIGLEGNVLARMGQVDTGIELVRQSLTHALQRGLTGPAAELYQRLADSLEQAGRYDEARTAYLEGADYCRTQSIEPTAQLCLACMSVVLWQTGEWDAAERTCREVITSPSATPHARAVGESILGLVTALRGRPGRARGHLENGLENSRRIELTACVLVSTWGLALCDRLEGDEEGALERCQDLVTRWEQTEERHYVVPLLRWAATLHATHGDVARVRACAGALARIAAQTAQPEAIAALGATLGEVALLEGDPTGASEHLTSALEALSARDLPFDRAEMGWRAGLALVRAERRAEGVSQLVQAARTARRLGADPLAAAIPADLRGLGESVERRLGRREALRLADGGLTRRELEIVRLVAHGYTSREIGGTLFISPRTVEMHVESALQKLDCRTRAEAAQRVASLGLLA